MCGNADVVVSMASAIVAVCVLSTVIPRTNSLNCLQVRANTLVGCMLGANSFIWLYVWYQLLDLDAN